MDSFSAPHGQSQSLSLARALLAWYDRHCRTLPWRALAGETADPYRVWLSEIMLQQTTVAAVIPYYTRFLDAFPSVEALAGAPSETVMTAWAGLGYYARARNLHACAKAVVANHGGAFPNTEEELRTLPGIGLYTAGAVAAIAFNRPAAAVDSNVERVITRLYAMETPLPAARPAIRIATQALVPHDRPGDFAQSVMDLGATVCTSRKPACGLCPWFSPCRARQNGTVETFPRKAQKPEKPKRFGSAFVAIRADSAILLRTRPAQGLLGGMAEPPTSEWSSSYLTQNALQDAPLQADWRQLPGVARHVFTHFELELTVYQADVEFTLDTPEGCRWTKQDALDREPIPTAMKKVLKHALEPEAQAEATTYSLI